MALTLQPITFREACDFVNKHHRHHIAPQGQKFAIAVNDGENVVGVVTIGRPVNRFNDNGWTAEVTRCCTDGTQHVASMLYGAAWRAVKAMGYKRLITYTLKEEAGTSLVAAGWRVIGESEGGTWSNKKRLRVDKHPIGQKTIWEAPRDVDK